MNKFIEAVRAYALANYEVKSWSYIVEAFDDEELAEEIDDASSTEAAIANVSSWVDMHWSVAEDIRNS
jgi:hypothetical protein